MHAGAKLRLNPKGDVVKKLYDESVRLSSKFNAQEAANCLWAVATIGGGLPSVVIALAKACVGRIWEFKPQHASISFWSIATLNV